MKKSMLYAGLMTILSATAYAEDSGNPNSVQTNPAFANGVQLALQQETQRLAASDSIKTPSTGNIQTPSDSGIQTPSVGTPTNATGSAPTPALDTSTKPSTGTQPPAAGTQPPASGAQTPATDKQASAKLPTTEIQTPDVSPQAPTTVNPATSTQAPTTGTQAPPNNPQAQPKGPQAPGSQPPSNAAPKPPSNAAPLPPSNSTKAPVAGTQVQTTAITPPQPLNCKYRIPSDTSHIEQTIVAKWAEKAAEQSFDYDFNNIDKQISELKACYTDQGWLGFNDALEKSGNLNAIKTQQLTVSSMVSGESKVTEIKDNQWKITIPMQVVYQNNKEKLTQPLTVNLVVGRKVSGDLGIMQMIAVPTQPVTNTAGGNPPANPAAPKPQ